MENNNNINNRFDEFFKNSFESFEPSLPDSTWNEIDQSVSNASAGSSVAGAKTVISIIIKAAAVLLPLAGITYFAFTNTSEEKQQTLTQTEQISNSEITAKQEKVPSDNSKVNIETNTQQESLQKEGAARGETLKQHNSSEKEIRVLSARNPSTHKGIHQPISNQYAEQGNTLPANKPTAPKSVSVTGISSSNSDVLNFTAGKSELCVGEVVEFKNTSKGFDRFRWDFDDGSYYDQSGASTVTHGFAKEGIYNITLLAYKGSEIVRYSSRLKVIAVIAYFSIDYSYAPYIKFNNQSKNAQAYVWDFGDHSSLQSEISPRHKFDNDGVAEVKLIAQNGACADTFRLEFNPTAKTVDENGLVIPNVFTPNNDGLNDEWAINAGEINRIKITILDRSGKRVFETTGVSKKWNGLDSLGKECPSGDYYYIVTYTLGDSEEKTKTGLLKLIR
ncbi:MAG TPA: gliding motility-associated C-terminal domain-containing protein [Bacteroidia bacterium]|nr:gliding motility-associated C-terminal domain-containing protein [Bacteroidia bacterium]